ncbi:hypothetical protein OIU77_003753 [Salix suchowensis]|uniref:Golgi apparatus membrane protein TVP23 n=1 Tax=Salix suchowensis TaxID=1278906 RepID=A0ABQ9AS39_9ROSI|nr:hypothetical protein OIU77_003753 [Salix suchowensis]
MDPIQPPVENYANPKTCFFHVLFKAGALAFYILSTLFFNSFVIIFVVTVLLAALDFWVVKNVSGRILVGLRWWNEINDLGESVWKFESLDQESLARMNKKGLVAVLVDSLPSSSCLDCAWNFLSHKVRTRLLPHCWSMPDSRHCKHCWLHQMSQRCQEAVPAVRNPDHCISSLIYHTVSIQCRMSQSLQKVGVKRKWVHLCKRR